MILTDYFRSEHDLSWDYAVQCGVTHGVIRLPEDAAFDITNSSHWETVYQRFRSCDITPVVIEPLPNSLHDHIKTGDALRDASIEKVLKMFPLMERFGIPVLCFNFMAYVGWTRTGIIPDRGGALVTEFDERKYEPSRYQISEEQLWDNYTYFIRAVIPVAERHGIRLALHPDDPPLAKLGNVSRILVSAKNIERAVYHIVESENLGITFCQATFAMMGENLDILIPRLRDKIFFIHFRNVRGDKHHFQETFHDNGMLDMCHLVDLYQQNHLDVPIRVDHVPTMAGEQVRNQGYDLLGRLYAIGYLKGVLGYSV